MGFQGNFEEFLSVPTIPTSSHLSQPPLPKRKTRRLCARVRAGLVEHAVQVKLHRALAQIQAVGDLFVREALCGEGEDFVFARGEGVFGGWLGGLLVGGFGQVAGFVEGLLGHLAQLNEGGEGLMIVGRQGEFVRADLIEKQFQRVEQAGESGIRNG